MPELPSLSKHDENEIQTWLDFEATRKSFLKELDAATERYADAESRASGAKGRLRYLVDESVSESGQIHVVVGGALLHIRRYGQDAVLIDEIRVVTPHGQGGYVLPSS